MHQKNEEEEKELANCTSPDSILKVQTKANGLDFESPDKGHDPDWIPNGE